MQFAFVAFVRDYFLLIPWTIVIWTHGLIFHDPNGLFAASPRNRQLATTPADWVIGDHVNEIDGLLFNTDFGQTIDL